VELAAAFGAEAVRWWLVRDVPRVGDTDFTAARLVARADGELANGIGNLVHRVTSMVHRYRDGRVPEDGPSLVFDHAAVDEALAGFDFRRASGAVWTFVTEANRYVNDTRPWAIADTARRDAVLGTLLGACQTIADELAPFLPATAARIRRRCTPIAGRLPEPVPLFRRFDLATNAPTGLT
jgi:methionyl-tRNA synthetase